MVGGTTAAARNVISGNSTTGVWIWWTGNNTVQGNYIGTDYTGTQAIGNGWCGVTVFCANNLIGGTDAGAGNLIANNGLSGIEVTFDSCTGNQILGNSIYQNGRLGIDLNNDGVTPNDIGDGDTGANNHQNFPVLDRVRTNGTQVRITGSLNSTPNTDFRIEFFANASPDPTGYGEGQRYLGYLNVRTDSSGNVTFSTTISASVAAGEYITATATNLTTHDTSEFAQNVIAYTPGITVTPTSGLNTSEDGANGAIHCGVEFKATSDVTIAITTSDPSEGKVLTPSLTFTPRTGTRPKS